jgi:hypothetical protein
MDLVLSDRYVERVNIASHIVLLPRDIMSNQFLIAGVEALALSN